MLTLSFVLLAMAAIPGVVAQTSSPKRGLIYIPSSAHPEDDGNWVNAKNSMTWYYNYQARPSGPIENKPANLEFVPMLWGDHANNFVADVRAQLPRVKYVLGFNEPDLRQEWGGSNIKPERAAELWKRDIQPLAADGVKLGAPGVSGAPDGVQWLKDFFAACRDCTFDFIPMHWYGDFTGLASQIGYYRYLFPGKDLWVTELGFAHQDIQTTEAYFKQALEYLDRLDYMKRYSWFGAFRSDVSNVGPSGAMMNKDGKVTNIGAWYMGQPGTGYTGNL